jgi:predicted XRE-type DNA-binding protein
MKLDLIYANRFSLKSALLAGVQDLSTTTVDLCWEWIKGKNSTGYGCLYVFNTQILAHRLSYIIYKGRLSQQLHVLHSCDNPACINPNHLRAGTDLDNVTDMILRGRKRIANGNKVKLTKTNIEEIKLLLPQMSQQKIADKFGVSQSLISSIKFNRHNTILTID